MTKLTDDDRRRIIAAAAQAAATAPDREVRSVSYKGKKLPLPVARVPLDSVLLNPRSSGAHAATIDQQCRHGLHELD